MYVKIIIFFLCAIVDSSEDILADRSIIDRCGVVLQSDDHSEIHDFVESVNWEKVPIRDAALCYLKIKEHGLAEMLKHKNCKDIYKRCSVHIKNIINKDEAIAS